MSITMPPTGRFGWASILVVGLIMVVTLMAVEARAQPKEKGKAKQERKPSPALSSLPKPAATGPLKILVVDDDWSDNNAPGRQAAALSRSDKVFRQLAAQAVGGDSSRWSVTFVELYRDGPDLARLRDYNVVIWYNGGGYGGNPDNSSVLSREDEKTARRYLEETGGTFILVSPGYLANFQYGNTWTSGPVPFLKQVLGIDGFAGLAQRFNRGVVTAWDGSRYTVEPLGHPEAQFSAVNPDGAAIVFSATLDPLKTAEGPVAVAVAHPHGRGRFVYVGFSLENLPELELAAAFTRLMDAAGWPNLTPPVTTGAPPQPAPPSPPVATGGTPTSPLPAATLPVKTPPPVIQAGGALRLPPSAQVAPPTQVTDAPQTFSLYGRDRQSFNFNTSQEGPIRLQVQATGAPVTVTIFHPDGRTNTQSGQGSFVVEDKADAADLARGNVWAVSVRLSSPSSERSVVSSGTIIVSHPPSDVTAVTAQLAAAKSKTVVLGKVPPLRTVYSLPESLRVTDTALPVERPPLPAIVRPVVPVRRVPIATPTVPAPVARIQVVTPGNGPLIPADVVGVRDALYVMGTDLFPPGVSAEELNRNPQQYGAELHFEYGNGQSATSPLEVRSGWGQTHYFGRVPVIPGVVNVPLSVFLKTVDGRTSNRSALVYRPWLVTKTVGLPIVDYNVVNNVQTAPFNFFDWIWGYKTGLDPDWRLYDSGLEASYSDAYVSAGLIIRDTYLFGFYGNDVFYKTLQLKNGWTTVSAKVDMWEARGAGAEVVEFTPGSTSLTCKVRWYLDPTFLDPNVLKYGVEITIQGPADFPPL